MVQVNCLSTIKRLQQRENVMSTAYSKIMFLFKNHRNEIVIAALLIVNVVFLYTVWKRQNTPIPHEPSFHNDYDSYGREIRSLIAHAKLSHITTKEKNAFSVIIFLTDHQCPKCIDEALPFWRTLSEKTELKVYFNSKSTSTRQKERMSQQYGIPLEWMETVVSTNPPDSLLWNSTAPSIILEDNSSGNIIVAHIGDRSFRDRSSFFYQCVIGQLL